MAEEALGFLLVASSYQAYAVPRCGKCSSHNVVLFIHAKPSAFFAEQGNNLMGVGHRARHPSPGSTALLQDSQQ